MLETTTNSSSSQPSTPVSTSPIPFETTTNKKVENIKVAIRVRPFQQSESDEEESLSIVGVCHSSPFVFVPLPFLRH